MQQSGRASGAQWDGNGSVSIKVSKWNIAVLHSGLESRGESGIQHTHTDTHLRCKVNTITAESKPSIRDLASQCERERLGASG